MNSVYIHIPFCSSICSYCDFPKVYYNEDLADRYLDVLKEEITNKYQKDPVRTIYIGGGTPSVLSLNQLRRLFEIVDCFHKGEMEEFTIECNVNDLTEEKLSLFKKYGVNRLSIGIETFQPPLLKLLNREHNSINQKLERACSYFDNVSVDLIYGIRGETLSDLKDDLKQLFMFDFKHISIYSLILEEHTSLYVNHYQEMDEDLNVEMYHYIEQELDKHGYHGYEISSYAKKGYESKHNLVYWNNKTYYGFGLGASAYIKHTRSTNTKNIQAYLRGETTVESHDLTKRERMQNEMILGLRKRKGVSLSHFKAEYGLSIFEAFHLKELIESKQLIVEGDYLFIAPLFLFTSNNILIHFLD